MASMYLQSVGSAVGGPIGGAIGATLGSYIDQNLIYPAIFGKPEGPRPVALEGFQLSTTDPGAPRWEVVGSRLSVPVHAVWQRGSPQVRAA